MRVLLLLVALFLTGCTSSEEPPPGPPPEDPAPTMALPQPSVTPSPRPRLHPPNYSHVNFRQRLDAALTGAGTVRFRVDRPVGYAAIGTAVIGDAEPARRLRTTSTDSGPDEYIEVGPTLCVSDSVMGKLAQTGLMSPLPTDLPWNCVTGESRYLSMMRSVVDGYDPLHVLAGLDPWLGFESLGLERVDGEELRHLRVGSAGPLGAAFGAASPGRRMDTELWIDRFGLPRRLVWSLGSGSTAEAVFEGWGDPADVTLPPEESQAHDDPGTRPSTFARGPQPPSGDLGDAG